MAADRCYLMLNEFTWKTGELNKNRLTGGPLLEVEIPKTDIKMPLPPRNSALDRTIDFVPNRVLQAQELERLQAIEDNSDVAGIGAMFRTGGTLNVKTVVTGYNVSLEPINPAVPMYVFVKNRL
jgi:hypothetical protein